MISPWRVPFLIPSRIISDFVSFTCCATEGPEGWPGVPFRTRLHHAATIFAQHSQRHYAQQSMHARWMRSRSTAVAVCANMRLSRDAQGSLKRRPRVILECANLLNVLVAEGADVRNLQARRTHLGRENVLPLSLSPRQGVLGPAQLHPSACEASCLNVPLATWNGDPPSATPSQAPPASRPQPSQRRGCVQPAPWRWRRRASHGCRQSRTPSA